MEDVIVRENIKGLSPYDFISGLSEGNEKARDVLFEIFRRNYSDYLGYFVELDRMNIRGIQICFALDFCEGDIELLQNLIKCGNLDLINYINFNTARIASFNYKAVAERDIFGEFPVFSKQDIIQELRKKSIKKFKPDGLGD